MSVVSAVSADSTRTGAPLARLCYLDLEALAAPACTAPKPEAALR